jgi:hypothetical protein
MTIKVHQCSCYEDCDKFSEGSGTTPDGVEWPMYYCDGMRICDEHIEQTERCGCMLHSKSKEYLCQKIYDDLKQYYGIH